MAVAWLCRSAPHPAEASTDTASDLLPISSSNGVRISLDLSTGREIASEADTDEPGAATPMATPRCKVLIPVAARDRAMQFITRANFGPRLLQVVFGKRRVRDAVSEAETS